MYEDKVELGIKSGTFLHKWRLADSTSNLSIC